MKNRESEKKYSRYWSCLDFNLTTEKKERKKLKHHVPVLGDFLTNTDYKTIMITKLPREKERNYNILGSSVAFRKSCIAILFSVIVPC